MQPSRSYKPPRSEHWASRGIGRASNGIKRGSFANRYQKEIRRERSIHAPTSIIGLRRNAGSVLDKV